jgi:hypothetical protein
MIPPVWEATVASSVAAPTEPDAAAKAVLRGAESDGHEHQRGAVGDGNSAQPAAVQFLKYAAAFGGGPIESRWCRPSSRPQPFGTLFGAASSRLHGVCEPVHRSTGRMAPALYPTFVEV